MNMSGSYFPDILRSNPSDLSCDHTAEYLILTTIKQAFSISHLYLYSRPWHEIFGRDLSPTMVIVPCQAIQAIQAGLITVVIVSASPTLTLHS